MRPVGSAVKSKSAEHCSKMVAIVSIFSISQIKSVSYVVFIMYTISLTSIRVRSGADSSLFLEKFMSYDEDFFLKEYICHRTE